MRNYATIALIAVCFLSAEMSSAGSRSGERKRLLSSSHHKIRRGYAEKGRVQHRPRTSKNFKSSHAFPVSRENFADPSFKSKSQVAFPEVAFPQDVRKLINANLEIACSLLESRGESARIKSAADHLQKLIERTRDSSSNLEGQLRGLLEDFQKELKQQQKGMKAEKSSPLYSLENDRVFFNRLDRTEYDEKLWTLLENYFNGGAFSALIVGGSAGAYALLGGEVGLYAGGGKNVFGRKYATFGVRGLGGIGEVGPVATVGGYKVKLEKGERTLTRTFNGVDEDWDFVRAEALSTGLRVIATDGNLMHMQKRMVGGEMGVGGVGGTALSATGVRIFKKRIPFIKRDYKSLRKSLGLVPREAPGLAASF